ncbi:Palmitoyltransferase Hip14 [Gryllus bimaculatus]|nr:Palmitoyltransferase Hip14 [Gryllus bimaculatus]
MEAATPEVPELLEGQVQQLVSDVGELRQEVKSLRAWQLRVSSLEQAIEKAVVTTMPKLDLLLARVTEEAENTYFANVALLWAAHEGRYEALQSLLESGVDVNKDTDEDGASALYYAAQSGHTACVAELLRRGADANLKCKKGESPLHRSSAYGHVECVRVLLAAGADKAAKNDNNKTALDIAGSETVRALLRTES